MKAFKYTYAALKIFIKKDFFLVNSKRKIIKDLKEGTFMLAGRHWLPKSRQTYALVKFLCIGF